jgi:chlorite dismutase
MGAQLNHTALAPYYTLPYSYLAMKRPSQYVQEHRHEAQEGSSTTFEPSAAPYFIVYPFLKTRDWYLLSKEERQGMMNAHFEVGTSTPRFESTPLIRSAWTTRNSSYHSKPLS